MAQPMPVVRQLYWPGLLPQIVAIAIITLAVRLCFGGQAILHDTAIACLVYLVLCRSLRAMFCSGQRLGIRAYRAQRFEEAITHFEESYRFFSAHRRLDAWRSFIFAVASANSYRVIALTNIAYCYAQLGDGKRSIEMFEQVLRESPDNTGAVAALRTLRAVSGLGEGHATSRANV